MNEEKCPICSATMVLRPPGISKKTGKPYEAFMSCPNYSKHPPKGQGSFGGNGNAVIMDEIQSFRKEINDRLDSMAQWLVEHIK